MQIDDAGEKPEWIWECEAMTKEDLMACRKAALVLHSIEKRILDLKKSAGYARAVRYDNEPRGRGEPLSNQQRYIENLEELSEEYEKTAARLAHKAAEIERAIRQLPPEMGELIRLRYVDGLRWDEVNETLFLSRTQSQRVHRKALEMILDQ